MNVPARLGSDDECVQAEVFYGDNRLKASDVRVTLSGPPENKRVRIEAATPVDEPVVTVSLRAGCRNTITRNYTLLPEVPSESVLAALMRPVPAVETLALAKAAAPIPALRMAGASGRTRAKAHTVVAAADRAAPRPQATKALRKEAGARGPRLRLEPIDLEPQPTTMLRVSANLSEADPARRATAALLWQAINADPQEVLRTSALLHKLEGDLASLRQAAGQTRSEMLALRRRLDETQKPWYQSAALAQLLAAMLLAASVTAGLLWVRTRRDTLPVQPWYGPAEEPQPPLPEESGADAVEVVSPAPVQRAAAAVVPPARPPLVQAPLVPVPVARPEPAVPAVFATAPVAPEAQAPGPIDFEVPVLPEAAPRRPTDGVLRVETLAATFEEVEFLASLGLDNDAMDVLKAYLKDSTSPAPLAFFELMRLCNEAEDATALPMLRRRYVQTFGLEAPRLEQVTAAIGLDSRPELSARITAGWGTQAALDLIEQALFSVPAPGAPLTLQAGRELLCLYDLGMALVAEKSGLAGNGLEAEAHAVAPWADADDAFAADAVTKAVSSEQGGHHFALDVDLGAAPAALPEPQQPLELQLAPLLAELQASAREAQERRLQEEEDAFSAAVASERMSLGRH